jgi:hypothetical protein
MIGALIGLLFLLIVAGFLFWAAQQLIGLIPLAEPFATLVKIVIYGLVLLVVLYALTILLGMAGISVPSFGGGHLR